MHRNRTIEDVGDERSRCAGLLQAVINTIERPSASTLVITAERMLAGPPLTEKARGERGRCVALLDQAARYRMEDRPAQWALSAIIAGLDLDAAKARSWSTEMEPSPANAPSKPEAVAERPHLEPELRDEPLTVDPVDGEVFVDGAPQVNVALTPEAAIETGVKLIEVGVKLPSRGGRTSR